MTASVRPDEALNLEPAKKQLPPTSKSHLTRTAPRFVSAMIGGLVCLEAAQRARCATRRPSLRRASSNYSAGPSNGGGGGRTTGVRSTYAIAVWPIAARAMVERRNTVFLPKKTQPRLLTESGVATS